MKKVLENLLTKDMNRKEFLGLIGAGALSVVGITALAKNLEGLLGSATTSVKKAQLDYGDNTYGGKNEKTGVI